MINTHNPTPSLFENKPNLSVRRFYALEYFYILLRSVQKGGDREAIFQSFLELKQEYRLGESKFKRLTADPEEISRHQESRFRYTFKQVIEESKQYRLIAEQHDKLVLKPLGEQLLEEYGSFSFSRHLFCLMEKNSNAFRYLIEKMYALNVSRPGLLIFPIYSPYQLGFQRRAMLRGDNVREYAETLRNKITSDITVYLGLTRDLVGETEQIIDRLKKAGLIPTAENDRFDPKNYNAIVTRFRKYWLTYFLQDLYQYDLSLSSFDMWIYRGKQCGVIHATEAYPGFFGKVVYPTSVLIAHTKSSDFNELYSYDDGQNLYLHEPDGERGHDTFIQSLVEAYHTLKRSNRNYFVNLASIRELVCYSLKVSEAVFEKLLNQAYRYDLSGQLQISISLEVDRLPEETRAAYLKQVPVVVDGKPRNIIAIDVKRPTSNE